MNPRVRYASFLVRLWRLSDRNGSEIPAGWLSEVESIQSGITWKFNTLEELEAFFRRQAAEPEGMVWIEKQEADS